MGVLGTYSCCIRSVKPKKPQNKPQHSIQRVLETDLSAAAFLSALIVGVSLHYHKIVENEYYGYPQEWFPSVSATIGDRYPERSVFMIFIAITSGKESCIALANGRSNMRQVLDLLWWDYGTFSQIGQTRHCLRWSPLWACFAHLHVVAGHTLLRQMTINGMTSS
jgi:hypothetical protein